MAEKKCTHGNGFCPVHQGGCEIHEYLMPDGKCTCKQCPPDEPNQVDAVVRLPKIDLKLIDELVKATNQKKAIVFAEYGWEMNHRINTGDMRIILEEFYKRVAT